MSESASLEHSCPLADVRVVSDNGDGYARLVELDVCGTRRIYHDVGGRGGYVWVDTTPSSGGDDADRRGEPDVGPGSSGRAGGAPPETLAAEIGARVDAGSEGILACAGAARAAVIVRHEAGADRATLGLRGDDSVAVRGCLDAAIGVVLVDPSQPAWELLHPITT